MAVEFNFDAIAVGDRFFLGEREYLLTDKGARTLIGIEIDDKARADPSWFTGPPYALMEQVFDEDDIKVISLRPKRF